MQIRTLIVDDEPLARSRMQRLLAQVDNIEVVGVAENGEQAIKLASELQPSLVFMDIQMPRMTGIDAADTIRRSLDINPPAIIFCTAYDEYAIDAFKVNATAYLLKPFSLDELKQAVRRASELSALQESMNVAPSDDERLFVKDGAATERLTFADINYFRSEEKHVLAGLVSDREVIVDMTLKEIEQNHPDQVLRVHRNSLVVKQKLHRLVRKEGKDVVELVDCDRSFQVSRRSLSSVRSCFA